MGNKDSASIWIIRKYGLLLFCLAFQFTLFSGNLPVLCPDQSPSHPASATYQDSNGIYFLSAVKSPGFANGYLEISHWNGLILTRYPVIKPNRLYADEPVHICKYQDSIFVSGSFIFSDSTKNGIVKFDGTEWVSCGGIQSSQLIHPKLGIQKMMSNENGLYLCGKLGKIAGADISGLAIYKQGQWTGTQNLQGSISDIEILNDSIFLSGNIQSVNGIPIKGVALHDGLNWQNLNAPSDTILHLYTFNNQLYAISSLNIFVWSNGTWNSANIHFEPELQSVRSVEIYNNQVYISALDKSIRPLLLRLDDQDVEVLLDKNNLNTLDPILLNNFQSNLYLSGNYKSIFGQDIHNYSYIFPGKTLLQGLVFKDLDENCMWSNMDEVSENHVLSLNNGAYYTSTDKEGIYHLILDPLQTYTLEAYPPNDYSIACGSQIMTYASLKADSTYIQDFAFHRNPVPQISAINLYSNSGFKARHGEFVDYNVKLSHVNKNGMFAEVEYPLGLLDLHCEQTPESHYNRIIRWFIQSDTIVQFRLRVDPQYYNYNDRFTLKAQLKDLYHEPACEMDSLTQIVCSAYDPNDKQCSESEITTTTHSLDYHIRFQNLGNDYARDVIVIDTISPLMPMQYIRVSGTSHPDLYDFDFRVRGHAMIWTFRDIQLGAKIKVGEHESSGFVQFISGLSSEIEVGDSIDNTAYIYFDFQAPVVTNQTMTKVVERISRPSNGPSIHIYPNPGVSGRPITIQSKGERILEYKIYDVTGRELNLQSVQFNTDSIDISAEELTHGVYFIRIRTAAGFRSEKLIIQ